jgi:hypothetical protein
MDGVLQKERLGELIQMNVRDLRYTEALKCRGKICDPDGRIDDVEIVTGDLSGVQSQPCGGHAGTKNEMTA